MFMKTHKTGSSSIQNCLFRYAEDHHLMIALMRNYNDSERSFNRDMIIDPAVLKKRLNTTYSMLLQHMIYNDKEVRAIMPEDTVYITVFREPVSLFQSLFNYYYFGSSKCGLNMSLASYIEAAARSMDGEPEVDIDCRHRQSGEHGRNQMAFDLGMDPKLFESEMEVKKLIDFLERRFDLVMITEMMDESVILMKNLLCWSTREVVFFELNKASDHQFALF